MGQEIERKFLLRDETWRKSAPSALYRQGLLTPGPPASVRVRIMGDRAMLNIKESTLDISRREFEYPLPLEDAEEILEQLCVGSLIEKTRHFVQFGGMTWEIDEFHGANEGLIVAEIEIESRDQEIEIPSWAGEEISGDPRYLNANLAFHPYSQWTA